MKPISLKTLCSLVLTLFLSGCQLLPDYKNTAPQLLFSSHVEKHHFSLHPKQSLIGKLATITTRENDTLPDIARHFGLGYNDITIANPHLDPWLVKSGDKALLALHITIPEVKRKGIVLNLANMRLFHFQKNSVSTYPIGIGRQGWNTPTGRTKIISKTKDPVWRVPASILREHEKKGDPLPRVVKAGKNNPLGQYAMRLSMPSYLIHGTNKPYGVGMQISHGCVRLYPENISTLFQATKVNTAVNIINQPYLLGWENSILFLEAHKPLKKNKKVKKALFKRIKKLTAHYKVEVDWQKIETILQRANGIPTPILKYTLNFQQVASNALPLSHPDFFYGQPQAKIFTANDWVIIIKPLNNPQTAKKLAAMLNHQGPQIPAQSVERNGVSQIVAGPFKSKKEAMSVQKRIKQDFQLTAQIIPPISTSPSLQSYQSPPRLNSISRPPPPKLILPSEPNSGYFFGTWLN